MHTGQHHDDELSTIFVTELGIPRPERELGIHGGSNTEQTARMLAALGPLVAAERPDVVLVYGDTNSTLAGGLAAAQARVPVAHVEAGMRSFDRAMPEELNRVLTDHLSDVLLCPSPTAVANLEREHVAGRIELVGDVMVDVALLFQPRARADDAPLREAGVSCGRVRAGHRPPRGQRRRPRAPARAGRPAARAAAGGRPPAAPAHPRAARGRRLARRARGRRAHPPDAAAGLRRLHVAALARPRGAHRLGRRAEGGLPGGRAVRDDARHDRVGGDRRRRVERAGRPRRRCGAGRAGAHAAGRASRALRRRARAGDRVVAALAGL